MAAILTLDDGRDFHTSNVAISGAYFLMARELGDRPRLRLWLFDLSRQCAPYFDVDLRALAAEDRELFWSAAKRAFDAVAARSEPGFLDQPDSRVANCLNRLLEEKESIDRGEARALGVYGMEILPIDIEKDRWFTDEQLEADFAAEEAEFQLFLASRTRADP